MQKEYKCCRCGKTFKRKYYYENHIYSTGIPCDHKIENTIHGKVLSKSSKISDHMVNDPTRVTANFEKPYHVDFKKSSDIKKNGKGLTINESCAGNPIIKNFQKNQFLKSSYCHGNGDGDHEVGVNKGSNKNQKNTEKIGSLNIYNTQIHNHINAQIINHNETKNINIVNNNLNVFHTEKLNAFGKENLDILTPGLLDSIIENPDSGIVKLIRFIHFNPNVPENRNVVIRNKKDPYFDVFNGDYWEKQEKDTTIHNLLSTKKDIMDDHFDNLVEKKMVTNLITTNYNDFSDKLDPYLKDNLESLLEEKLNRKNLSKKCETIYKKLYGKIMLLMMNDKEINKVLQRKLNKIADNVA